MSLDEEVLSKLLRRGESARRKRSERLIRETAFAAADSAYWKPPLETRDRFEARMRAAAAAGAVRLEWSRQGGDDRPLEAVCLADLDRLAAFLGVATVRTEVAVAESILSPWLPRYRRVREIIDAWAAQKQVRTFGPSSAADLADALRVLDAVAAHGDGEDRLLRGFSAGLFRDSKRIERLDRHLDALTADSIATPARRASEVFALLGLRKEPQPFLLAGSGVLVLADDERCPLVRPFVGVAAHAVTGYAGTPTWVMTIENLATFHQAAIALAKPRDDNTADRTTGPTSPNGDPRGLVIYTAGMPSPSWCRAYARLLASLPEALPAYHWGDIDAGGFRIAAHLRQACIGDARPFLPWSMDATAVIAQGKPATDAVHRTMIAAAERAGWDALAARLPPATLEQEALPVRLPG